jgi:acyl-CoA reductase-like NAD-dependent aldehyde dehydrogenase
MYRDAEPMSQIEVYDPFTREKVFSRPSESFEAMDRRIDAAQEASRAWRRLPPASRADHVQQALGYFRENRARIAEDVTREVGKTLQAAGEEVDAMLERAEYLCTFARDGALEPDRHPQYEEVAFEGRIECRGKGVVYIITPWNYPLFCAINGTACALLSGSAVVLKHTTAPSVGEHFEKAFGRLAGIEPLLSPAVVDFDVSARIIEESDIDHVVFTGSVRGGRSVQQSVAKRAFRDVRTPFIPCSLELGGSDPAYVAADADLDDAVHWTVKLGRLHNSGQSCCAVKRVYVHEALHDEFLTRAKAVMQAEKSGDPRAPDTTLGPLHGGDAAAKALLDVVQEAVEAGARLLTGGATRRIGKVDFLEPTLLADVAPGMRVLREETFGPVLPVRKVASDAQAIEEARDSAYALTASIFTTSRRRAEAFVEAMDTGTVYVNRCNFVDARLGWIGQRASGNGSLALAPEGLRAFSARQSVNVDPTRLR